MKRRRRSGRSAALTALAGLALLFCLLLAAGLRGEDAPLPRLCVTEILSRNDGVVAAPDGAFYDYVELYNAGEEQVLLSDFLLSDDPADPFKAILPRRTLEPGAYTVVFLGGYDVDFSLAPGETVTIYDTSCREVSGAAVLSAGSNRAQILRDGVWAVGNVSPGYENSEAGEAAYSASIRDQLESRVRLSELMAKNRTTPVDGEGATPDWIEIENTGDEPIDISGFSVSDGGRSSYTFPAGTALAPGYSVLPVGDGCSASFGLSAGECVSLFDGNGRLLDSVTIPSLDRDLSLARIDGEWSVTADATPGFANTDTGRAAYAARQAAWIGGSVSITEVMSINRGRVRVSDVDPSQETDLSPDWIEITNTGDTPVDLAGWSLGQDRYDAGRWTFSGGVLQPGERKVVFLDVPGGPDFGISGDGDSLWLFDGKGRIACGMDVPALRDGVSWGETESGAAFFTQPTPGAENGAGYARLLPDPAPDVPDGVYNGVTQLVVSFSVPDGATLRYTTDGSAPNADSPVYGSPFVIASSSVIRVVLTGENAIPSRVMTYSYIVNENHTMDIVSLVADSDDLFGSGGVLTPKNAEKDIEKPVSVAYYAQDGCILRQDGGILVFGGYTRRQAQKSLQLVSRDEYSGDSEFRFNPFSTRDYAGYHSLVLRNTGQDYNRARMRDAMLSSLLADADSTVLTQAYQPVIVYLNGEYYGQYYLREKINRHMVAQYEGVADEDVDSIALLRASGKSEESVISGSNAEWLELLDYVKNHDLRDEEALRYVTDRVDVENLFDYFAFQIIIGNSDPSNIKFYKVPGGKWRWIVYDLDWSFNTGDNGVEYDSVNRMLKKSGMGRNDTDNSLIRALLRNPDMERLFLTRMANLLNGVLSQQSLDARIDAFAAILSPEIDRECAAWSSREETSMSRSRWESAVQSLHTYASRLRPNLLSHVQDWFDLSDGEMAEIFGE